jgi:rhodanese-related sulfurtransferase
MFCVVVGSAFHYADPKVRLAIRVKESAERIAPYKDFGPVQDVSFETVREGLAVGTAVLVDTRGILPYSKGKIEGSIAIPKGELTPRWAVLTGQLRRREKWTIICLGHDAQDRVPDALAAEIIGRGVGPVAIYRGGWKDWVDKGGPIKRR